MRRLIFIVTTLLFVGVVFAAPPREWLATPTQQQAILRLVQEQQQLDAAEKQLRDARTSRSRLPAPAYNKNNKLVFAFNNAGTMTYVSIALDGAATTWTQSTTAP